MSQHECINDFVNKVEDIKVSCRFTEVFSRRQLMYRYQGDLVLFYKMEIQQRSATVEDFLSHFMIQCMSIQKGQPM
jgi:hypothetical protein